MPTNEWLGRALDIYDVWTFTVANTWAASDTATVTINTKSLTLTVGGSTTTEIATNIATMVNGGTLTSGYSVNAYGNVVGEFVGITATVSGSTVTLTGDTAGRPFTPTVSESTAGSGTLSSLTNATAATSKNHWDNVNNWSLGIVPISGHDLVIPKGDVSILYGISTSIQPASFFLSRQYSGYIGLPEYNTDNPQYPFKEYLTTHLTFGNNSVTCEYNLGQGDGLGSKRVKLDFGAGRSTVNVFFSGTRLEQGVPAFLFKGTHSQNVCNVIRGDVGWGYFSETASLLTARSGYSTDRLNDSYLAIGKNVTLTNILQTGGEVHSLAATTTWTQEGGAAFAEEGAHAAITARGGRFYYNSDGDITSLTVLAALFSMEQDVRTTVCANEAQLYRGAELADPHCRLTGSGGGAFGFQTVQCSLADVRVNLGVNKSYTSAT
jgi:hypothetical protein